jgi:hypothetical protein
MATTTNYSWTTPDDTALVKDGAAAIRSLGTAIDTTVFNNASAGIAKTIVDAKGDLIAATAADTVARLAVGSNDQVLTADSSTATGLKWATAASGGMTLISTTTLTGASVLLDSIPSTYNHLQLVVQNYKPATDGQNLFLRFNGDSTANRYNDTNGSAETSDFDDTKIIITGLNDNSVATGLAWVNIPSYANSTTWKFLNSLALTVNETTTANYRWANFYGFYNQIAAISSITLAPTSGNFTSGTVLLYGVK